MEFRFQFGFSIVVLFSYNFIVIYTCVQCCLDMESTNMLIHDIQHLQVSTMIIIRLFKFFLETQLIKLNDIYFNFFHTQTFHGIFTD